MNGKLTRRGFVALAGGLLVGGALAGTAFAQQAPVDPNACPMGFGDARGPGRGQGVGAGPGAGRSRGFGPAAGQPGVAHEAIAAALGMTSDELFAAQRGGKTVADLAQEKGVDLETVVTAAVGAHKQALDAQVQAGQLTQTQADQMQARQPEGLQSKGRQSDGPPMTDRRTAAVEQGSRRTDDLLQEGVFQQMRHHRFMAKLLLPALNKAARRYAVAQVRADQALLACGIERYRLAEGRLPETLDQLTARHLPRRPHDVLSGEPFTYERKENQFVLSSVGSSLPANQSSGRRLSAQMTTDNNTADWQWHSAPP